MTRQRMIPLALAAIFVAPLALAWAVYHGGADGHPRGGLQHGELLLPLQPLAPPPLTAADGTPFAATAFHGRWTLLYRGRDRCDAACRQLLVTLQQVRLAQGPAMARVQRVVVLAAPPGTEEVRALGGTGGDLRFATAARWALPAGSVYLVDPQGNLVLRYRPGFEPRGLLRDLQRLLRLSGAV